MRSRQLMFEGHGLTVRYTTDDRPWLEALTLCDLLGYADWRSALLEHCHPADILFGDEPLPRAFISLNSLQRLSTHAPSPRAKHLYRRLRELHPP